MRRPGQIDTIDHDPLFFEERLVGLFLNELNHLDVQDSYVFRFRIGAFVRFIVLVAAALLAVLFARFFFRRPSVGLIVFVLGIRAPPV